MYPFSGDKRTQMFGRECQPPSINTCHRHGSGTALIVAQVLFTGEAKIEADLVHDVRVFLYCNDSGRIIPAITYKTRAGTVRHFGRILILLLLLAGLFPFLWPLRDGKPLLSPDEIKMPSFSLPNLTLPGNETETRPAHQTVTLYRWQDADGSVHFGSEVPAAGIPYQTIEVHPDANLIQSTPPNTPQEGEKQAPSSSQAVVKEPSAPTLPLSLSPERIQQLIEQAKGVQQLGEQRQRQQEALSH